MINNIQNTINTVHIRHYVQQNRRMIRHCILFTSSFFVLISCSGLELTSKAESEELEYFFPLHFFEDQYYPAGDTSAVIYYSAVLNSMNEPSLSKYSQEITAYRITLLSSFDYTKCVRVEKGEGNPIIYWKMTESKSSHKTDELTMDEVSSISLDEWNSFEKIVENSGFWKQSSPESKLPSGDGSTWLIEAYSGGKYHLIERSNPSKKEAASKIGTWLLKATGFEQ